MPSAQGVKVRRVRDRSRKKYPPPPPKKVLPELIGAGGVSSIGTAQQTLAQLREAIVITDADFKQSGPKIVYVNEAFTRLTGYPSREVIGKNPAILQGPKTTLFTLAALRSDLAKGRKFEGEDIVYRKDGSEFHMNWYVEPLRNDKGRIAYFVTVQRDVTTEREAQIASLRDERLQGIGLLARSIAHDLNNILTPILMGSDLLDRKVDDPDTTQLAGMLDRSADRGAGLVRQLLALARGLTAAGKTLARDGGGRSVLIVDDEVAVTEMMKEILASAGYTVATANTMSDALARAEDMLPDAIVLGLRLARSMNNSLLMEFRSRFRHASLLVTSELPRDEIPEIVTQTSAVLQKPFTVENLLIAVHDVLAPELIGTD
jgi:PAS domain S-box-containing protein